MATPIHLGRPSSCTPAAISLKYFNILDEHIESVACTAASIGRHVGAQSSSGTLRCCSAPLFLHPFTQRQAPLKPWSVWRLVHNYRDVRDPGRRDLIWVLALSRRTGALGDGILKGILDAPLLLDVPLFGELGIDVGSSVSAAVLDSHPTLYSTIRSLRQLPPYGLPYVGFGRWKQGWK